jgi:3-phenylpropionate/trans-cinnamate dioxygenase ferredoxin subunit
MPDDFTQAARLADVPPGTMKCVSIGATRVLLANCDGVIRAADEMCTHEDASLCLGSLRGHLVKCPLHGSRFDLATGAVLDEPADTPLRLHAVKVEGDAIFVKLAQD